MRPSVVIQGFGLWLCTTAVVRAQNGADAPIEPPSPPEAALSGEPDAEVSAKQRMLDALPAWLSDGLDFDLWAWFGYLRNSEENHYWDAEVSVGVTKSFDQKVVLSAQVNFIDANDTRRVELGAGYLSALLSDRSGTIFTVGKFNANFGVEGRDFWERQTGTPSLLFGAQPQDLVGGMVTQPIGETGVTLRPFISADFQGGWDFNQPPGGGVKTEYSPGERFHFTVTNWVGPGFVLYGGRPLEAPYPASYGSDAAAVTQNWQGPYMVAERAGTLYFVDASLVWKARPDLTLSAEYLMGTTGSEGNRWGWQGWMVLGVFDVNDRLHVYGRWSYLDDDDWLVTGFFQRRQEVSGGAGLKFLEGLEVRGELRYDSSDSTPDVTSVSIHLTYTF